MQADRGVTDDIAEGSFEVVEWELSAATPLMLIRSGTYTGNAVDNRPISVGFQPDVVIVDREDLSSPNPNDEAVIRTSTMLGDLSKNMDVNAGGTVLGANRVQSLDPMGFTVGTDNNVNQNGIVYHWVAFKAGSGQLKVGTYAGTGVAQNITGVGFGPAYLMVVSRLVRTTSWRSRSTCRRTSPRTSSHSATRTRSWTCRPTASASGRTRSRTTAARRTTTSRGRRSRGASPWAPTRVGAPADNRNITGTGFWPEWVVVSRASNVAGSQTNPPVHKPASTGVGADWALLFDGTLAENNNIQNLQADGFQIGNHARVNNAGAPNTYYWAAFGPHVPQARYRSIGTAADLTNQGTITVTAGSTIVTKVGGTGWKTANRGRGDRLSVGTDHYLIASVDSDTALTLTAPAVTSYTGSTYTIARLFATLQGWEDCVSRSAINTCKRPADTQEYFPTASSSLVADDRSEVGIAYKDSVFTTVGEPNVTIDGSTTDATHTITLTADPGNRHYGIAGAGVILDGGAATDSAVLILDDFVTVEWLEIRGGGSGFDGVEWQSIGAVNKGVARYLLIHNLNDNGIQIQDSSAIVDVYNNILYRNGGGLRNVSALSTGALRIFNNTVFGNTSAGGITGNVTTPFLITLRNNVSLGNVGGGGDYNIPTPAPESSNNLASDLTGSPHGGLDNVTATASPTICGSGVCVGFNNITATTENLHLIATTYTNRALDTGANLGTLMPGFDIDTQVRAAPWDIGADEFNGTTAVTLQAFSAIPADRAVVLEWRTASELSNLGFHVYRASSEDGPWTRLTTSLIPGLGSSAVGQAYSYRDFGLQNGTRYFYRLEDVDASSKTTSHGPVSAVPSPAAVAANGAPGAGKTGAKKGASAPSCPDWVLAAYGSSAGSDATTASLTCTRHGDPEATSLGVVSRDARQATLELRTGGFYALHEASGTVRVFVPGFDFPQDDKAAALPIRRALADAVVGRRVQLAGVRALELASFRGLVPSALGKAEMQVGQDGTVRAARRRPSRAPKLFPKRELATLLPSVFQGETKSAALEIAPLRFEAQRQQLVLAKRVLVRLLFTGRETGESGQGRLGRAPGSTKPDAAREVLARLYTTARGLHAAAFEQLFPGAKRGFSASQLRLERQGEAVAFHLEPTASSFGPGSRLYFYADRTAGSTAFSGEVAYELVRSGGVDMPLRSAAPGSNAVTTASSVSRSFETDRFYQPGLLDAPDPWLWEALASGATRLKSFALAGVSSSGEAGLDVYLQGASESGQAVDHHVSVSLNGALVGEARFAGKLPYRMSLRVPASLLREGSNDLSLTSVADTGVSSLVFLDRFGLSHPQASSLAGGLFEGAWSESGTASVSGLTASPVVVDVTGTPEWLSGYEIVGRQPALQRRRLTPLPGRFPGGTARAARGGP